MRVRNYVLLSDESFIIKMEIDQLKYQQCFNLQYLHVWHKVSFISGFLLSIV